jgi:hypothetical protein
MERLRFDSRHSAIGLSVTEITAGGDILIRKPLLMAM